MDTNTKKENSHDSVPRSSEGSFSRAPLKERDWDQLRELVRENREINERYAEK
jgi:hypothetical protein